MKTRLLALAAVLLAAGAASAGAAGRKAAPKVLLAPYSGIIQPVAAEFLTAAVSAAEARGADALVIELDTPGGLDLSMREIVKAIMGSGIPVIAYVHPAGGRAASAGVFITMAAHLAAMTPGTNIGAAHPVSLPTMGVGGEKTKAAADKVMEGKVVNDASAYLKSIALERGRNAEWAIEAVAKSTSIPATEAVSIGVVDMLADDLGDLLEKADGRKLKGFDEPLRTAGASVERFEMTRRQRWLSAVSDPNVAMILMSLGAAGLFIELYNPGLIFPGVVGAVCLLLAFYSFQTLSASYTGVLLIMAGLVFFLLEIKVTSYGMLALGGTAATFLGMLMLFQQSLGGIGVSWSVILGVIGTLLGVTALISFLVVHAYRRRVPTGNEGMVGQKGTALSGLSPEGKVMVQGEIWKAAAEDGPIEKGAKVVVSAIDGMVLTVRKA